jgi:hypothetical protein
MNKIFDAIKHGGFQLKKAPVQDNANKVRNASEITITKDPRTFAPSLNDILKGKHNLKSPDKVYHAYQVYSQVR